MEKELELVKKLLTTLLNVNTYIFSSKSLNIYESISKLFYLPNQFFDSSKSLDNFITQTEHNTIYHIIDSLDTSYCFVKFSEWYLFLGPYTTQKKKSFDAFTLVKELKLPHEIKDELLSYFNSLPIIDKGMITHVMQEIIVTFDPDSLVSSGIDIIISQDNNSAYNERKELINDIAYITTNHHLEAQFMEKITQGNATEAKRLLNIMFKRSSIARTSSDNKWLDLHEGHAIVRTIIRLAAKSQGIPSAPLDSIISSGRIAASKVNSGVEINRLLLQTIDNVCTLVMQYRLNKYSSNVNNAIEFILSNLNKELSVKLIANQINVSPNYLSALFKRETGNSITQFVKSKRLESAKKLLSTTSMPINHISASIGIDNNNYFSKIFKEEFGKTPKEYRKNHNFEL